MDGGDTLDDVLIILFDVSSTRLASYCMSLISGGKPYLQFVSFQTGSNISPNINLSDLVALFIKYNNKSSSVIFFSDDVKDVVAVLEAVSLSEQLRFTGLLHTTEWFIVFTVLVDDIPNVLIEWSRTVDFITLVYMPCINTTFIAQQSRVQNLTVKAKVIDYNIHPVQQICEVSDWPGISCGVFRSPKEILRKSARLFLKSQKSMLEGMRLPVAVTESLVRGNLTSLDKHARGLLDLLATSLGFEYQLVSNSGQHIYGEVIGEANGTGIAGILARREAALSTMPLSLTDNRLKAIDFIPVLTFEEPFFIFYRWPQRREKIDLIYIYIVKWEFIYLLIGTVLFLGIIGAIVHTTTRSCSMELTEPFSAADIRRLSSFLDHVCFRYSRTYVAHSGRILLACWAVFLVVLGSAYSGFLVTDFVTADAPPIKTLEQLTSNKDFRVGIYGVSDLTIFLLNTSTDGVLKNFWARLQELNSKDPETFTGDLQVHIKKILTGRYAHVGSVCFPHGMCDKYIPENVKDLVFFQVEEKKLHGNCYVSVSKGVFFQRELYLLLLRMEQVGFQEFLKKKYVSSKIVNHANVQGKSSIYQTDSENTKVGFLRILFVVYLALGGVGVGVVCLMVELIVSRLHLRNSM